MSDPIDELLAASRARGERVAVATALDGARAGDRLLVWAAGHTFGDLGWPRLNQRVALYAEQLFERGTVGAPTKKFDVPGAAKVEIRLEIGDSLRNSASEDSVRSAPSGESENK